jgi:hypothetical protein
MRHYELLYNGHLHTEKLAHAIFVALTTLIIGSWTISIRYLESLTQRILIDILPMTLAVIGLFLVYKLQGSVEEAHLIMNRIRGRLGHNELRHGAADVTIFGDWLPVVREDLLDFGCIPRKGIRSTGGYSWWAAYKWLYALMYVAGICLMAVHLSSGWPCSWATMFFLIDVAGGIVVLYVVMSIIVRVPNNEKTATSSRGS